MTAEIRTPVAACDGMLVRPRDRAPWIDHAGPRRQSEPVAIEPAHVTFAAGCDQAADPSSG